MFPQVYAGAPEIADFGAPMIRLFLVVYHLLQNPLLHLILPILMIGVDILTIKRVRLWAWMCSLLTCKGR
jgi:hypothetical protein